MTQAFRWTTRFGLVATLLAGSLLPGSAAAQTAGDGPTALIVSYRVKPADRVKFRAVMASDGVAQLERWKKDGVFASYNALYSAYAAESAPDMFLVLRFSHFSDLAHWQTIEQTNPGGLPLAAQSMAAVETSGTADVLGEKRSGTSTPDSQFFVLEYDVLADGPKYASYVKGYVVPQFEGWMKTGGLLSYATYQNQNPAGAAWGSFFVLEYKNINSLGTREVVKAQTRAGLAANDPVWKKWSDDKTAIRTEKANIPALALR